MLVSELAMIGYPAAASCAESTLAATMALTHIKVTCGGIGDIIVSSLASSCSCYFHQASHDQLIRVILPANTQYYCSCSAKQHPGPLQLVGLSRFAPGLQKALLNVIPSTIARKFLLFAATYSTIKSMGCEKRTPESDHISDHRNSCQRSTDQ